MGADSVAHELYYQKNSGNYGDQKNLGLTGWKKFRQISCTLGMQRSSYMSEEGRADRNVANVRAGVKQIPGDIGVELSYRSYDDILQAVLMSKDWKPVPFVDGSTNLTMEKLSGSGSGTNITRITAGTQANVGKLATIVFPASGNSGYADGDKIKIEQGEAEVVITLHTGDAAKINSGGTITVDATNNAPEYVEYIRNYNIRSSFALLRDFSDLKTGNNRYHPFYDCEFESLNLSFPVEGIITGSYNVLGRTEASDDTDTLLSTNSDLTTPIIPSEEEPFDAFTGELKENNNPLGIATELSFNLVNNLGVRHVIFGGGETLEPTAGRCVVTGNLTAFFENRDLLRKFYKEIATDLVVTPKFDGRSLTFKFPHLKFTTGQPDTANQGPVPLAMQFQATYGGSSNPFSIEIIRNPNA